MAARRPGIQHNIRRESSFHRLHPFSGILFPNPYIFMVTQRPLGNGESDRPTPSNLTVKAKKTRKFAAVKRMLNPNDIRLKENQLKQKKKEEEEKEKLVRRVPQVASSLFFAHNTALVPPYRVLIDTNFINFSLQNKLELMSGMMDCLFAKCIPCVTDCVMAELEKLGHRYRVALRQWIWVQGSASTREDTGIQDAIEEASALLKEVTEKVEAIKSIPLRSNKKTGVKSKKEVREQAQAEAAEKLKEIAIRHGYVSGKWLIFASADKVDTIWTKLASMPVVLNTACYLTNTPMTESLVSGPLASTFAHLAKVATSPESQDSTSYQHLIFWLVEMLKLADRKVMRTLLQNHGVSLSGVKSNLYTALGIDSKHASGLPSTTWKNAALISDAESKELRDAFFADLASNKITSEENRPQAVKGDLAAAAPSKSKPKFKKKDADDPFATDDDDADNDEDEKKRKQELQAKVKKAIPKKVIDDPFVSDEDEEGAKRREKVRATKGKSVSIAKKRRADDIDEEQRPRKRNPAQS
ncbi:hypothetical protein C0995_000938 [Termitomyces sp. Mi166|nr:hypothetical protein C0995_000938 [Termitomyces sp. Mi166\